MTKLSSLSKPVAELPESPAPMPELPSEERQVSTRRSLGFGLPELEGSLGI